MEEANIRIKELQDLKYREFQCRLIPNIATEKVIGVRTPLLRTLAKDLIKEGKGDSVLAELPHYYYDENNLHGFILSELKDYDQTIAELERFLPYIDNWATCDLLRPKAFRKKSSHKRLIADIRRWMADDKPFTIRFGIEMLMTHFLDESFQPAHLAWVAAISSEHYYVRMMVAWYFATALSKQYSSTIAYIEQYRLSPWNHNKAIQKATESLRITSEQKQYLKTLRIKLQQY